MKASQFSDAQKAFILKQGHDGVPVAEICLRIPTEAGRVFRFDLASACPRARRRHGTQNVSPAKRQPKPRGRRPDIFKDHWEEMAQCLEEWPDQTALELLVEFQARYPGRYSLRQLYTLQKRVRLWRGQAVRGLSVRSAA
jgi:hypothetical protein